MKKPLQLLFFSLFTISMYSQHYTRDVGFRGGTFPGLSYRLYNGESNAIEGIVSLGQRGLRLTLLKEQLQPALLKYSDNFQFVYGYGVHAGFSYTNRYDILFRTYRTDNWHVAPLIGLDAILALEYQFREFPFTIGLEYKPFFEFSTHRIFYLFLEDVALSFKYNF